MELLQGLGLGSLDPKRQEIGGTSQERTHISSPNVFRVMDVSHKPGTEFTFFVSTPVPSK